MILHCVFIRFSAAVTPVQRQALLQEIAALVGIIPGLRRVDSGPNARFEALDHGYGDGFVAHFDDERALSAYQAHPAHRETATRLVAAAEGGTDGIFVFDLRC
jgi:hypothetical protein